MKPILFNTDMVRAILDGRKTVMRRAVKSVENTWKLLETSNPSTQLVMAGNGDVNLKIVPGTWATFEGWNGETDFPRVKCPYSPGDIRYVRETWNYGYFDGTDEELASQNWFEAVPLDYAGIMKHCCHYVYRADFTAQQESELGVEHDDGSFRMDWRPAIHMPKEAARIFLRVKGVRVERLRDIPLFDVWDEGTPQMPGNDDKGGAVGHEDFAHLWDSTLKLSDRPRYGWDANPWVWRIEFERISREEASQ